MNLVLVLDQLPAVELSLVGGKARSLARMSKAGMNVPDAICVTTEAYRSYVTRTGLREKILLEIERKSFSEMRWEELWDSSLRLRNLFLTTPIPSDLRDELLAAIQDVFHDSPLAIRSSALGEDSSRMSFAGLHESYLNICGSDGILDHICLVWASLFSDRALLYRQELDLDPRQSAMAVVIQEMIDGERSGIVFGMSPVDPDQAVVEAVHGLNQDLVDGVVTPHRWILNRLNGEIISFRAPGETSRTDDQTQAKFPHATPALAGPPLNQNEVKEVFKLARHTETLFRTPQDVEWTYRGTTLFALQSRPITSGEAVPGDDRRWYLTLRRTYENLRVLRDDIEKTVLPAMQRAASEMAAMDLTIFSDKDLAHEIERRRGILDDWEQTYKEKCIPFAHGMRLFAEVYNDRVRPDDPFEFMDLLGAKDMLSIKRNTMLQELAGSLRDDAESFQCLYRDNMDGCGENVRRLVAEFRNAFGDLTWGSTTVLNNSRQMATLMRSYIEMGSTGRTTETKTAEGLVSRFLASFPESRKDYASTLLDLARASYRLRDDDNIYVGKIRRQVVDAEEEARRRGISKSENPCTSQEPQGALPCKQDSEPLPHHRPVLPIFSHDPIFNIQARQVVGQPAGAGLATGKARVISLPADLVEFRAGEILVCDAIDPNMTFVVPLAAGIVERRGGMLIHGAIIAREYGIPCVTGVPAATEVIRTGDTVTVDGFLGIVIIG